MRINHLLLLFITGLVLSSCGKQEAANSEQSAVSNDTSTSTEDNQLDDVLNADTSPIEASAKLAAENLQTAQSFFAENALLEETIVLPSGLQYQILEEGPADGDAPETGDIIDIEYSWAHLDGTKFDSSDSRGGLARTPFVPQLGEGVFEGMSLLSTGDKYRFFIPPALAFGEAGTPDGIIAPNEALIFEVRLAEIAITAKELEEQAQAQQQIAQDNLEKAKSFLSENAQKEGIITTDSGLQYKVLEQGPSDQASPTAFDQVKVHYRGTLIDGTEFDSSYSRGTPTEFGVGNVISGWTEGLQLMSVGDKYQFFITPELGYGENPRPGGAIGPNDALIFEVELLEVK